MERAACQSRTASVKKPREVLKLNLAEVDVEGFLRDSAVIPGVRLGFGGAHRQAAKLMTAIVRLQMFTFLLVCLFLFIFFALVKQGGGESCAGVASHPRADVAVWHPGALFHRHGLHLHHPKLPAGNDNNNSYNNNILFNRKYKSVNNLQYYTPKSLLLCFSLNKLTTFFLLNT